MIFNLLKEEIINLKNAINISKEENIILKIIFIS